MDIFFFIKSRSVDITHYTIKDIPGSSGRLDVISRCILAAILIGNGFENNIQIWVFLEKYGTFIFRPKALDYNLFPKSEIMHTDYFVDVIKNREGKLKHLNNPLKNIEFSNKDVLTSIKEFMNKYKGFSAFSKLADTKELLKKELNKEVDFVDKDTLDELGKEFILKEVKYV